jgi:uracil-DNA glycosylase
MIELNELYQEIHNCHICPKMDKFKELRNVSAVSQKTKVFIISQALAEKQLRLSGVNFFQMDGNLGSTGKQLEKFLNLFNQTVFPAQEIVLKDGTKIPKCGDNLLPVYNTEITQCFPGKGINGDRVPDSLEIENCLEKNFLFNEIKIIKPKLLLLMGRLSIKTFYKFILGNEPNISTNEMIDDIVRKGIIPKCELGEHKIGFLPIQHASGLNPQYPKMLKNFELIKLIKEYFNE